MALACTVISRCLNTSLADLRLLGIPSSPQHLNLTPSTALARPGSCEYYYLDPNVGTGWDVAAPADANFDFGGSCGR